MADNIYFFVGEETTTPKLSLSADTDNFQLLVPGTEMGVPEPENVMHKSAWQDGDDMVRHRDGNRLWPMRFKCGDEDSATKADTLANSITEFGKLMSQAERSNTIGDIDKVCLYIKMDGATNATYYDVVTAAPNGQSLLDEFHRRRGDGEITITLETKPYGYGDEELLYNYVSNPGFVKDTDSDGLANGWKETGSPTTSIDTTNYLVGWQSQKVVTDDSSTEGIGGDGNNAYWTGSSGTDFLLYAWVYRSDGADEITLEARSVSIGSGSGSVNLGSATYGASTVTVVDAAGDTWRRLTVTGQVNDTGAFQMLCYRDSGDASEATTFSVDKVYAYIGDTSIPTAWSSRYYAGNVWDETENEENFIVVTDVPGDIDALTKFSCPSSNNTDRVYVIRDVGAWSESDDFIQDESGTADVSSLGDEYSAVSVATSWTTLASKTLSSTRGVYNGKFAAFARVYDDGSDGSLYYRIGIQKGSEASFEYSEKAESETRLKWLVQYSGIVDITDPAEIGGQSNFDTTIVRVQAMRSSGSATGDVRIDFFMLTAPTFMILDSGGTDFANVYMDSEKQVTYGGSGSGYKSSYTLLGEVPSLSPVSDNQFTFILEDTSDTNRWFLNNYILVAIRYRPRSRFLLGTT